MQQTLKIKALIYLFLHLLTFYFLGFNSSLQAKQEILDWSHLPIDARTKEKLSSDDAIYCTSQVDTQKDGKKEFQSLDYFIAGLHKKKYRTALSKLSQYERYQEFIDFVKKSQYDKEQKRIKLHLGHILMPFDMILDFELPRITQTGIYPFRFNKGFLKGLTGEISISQYNNRCLFATQARWKGKKTSIPDQVLSFFSQSLGKNAMETLFRISLTR